MTDQAKNEISLRDRAEIERLEQELAEAKRAKQLEDELPHLYGWKWYPWARSFFESKNRVNLLCAANQISKSSTQIRKMIHWATAQHIWPTLWRTRPRQFWYLYPSKDVATAEFETKWVTEFLPRGTMKDHPVYGWEAKYQHGQVHRIIFNSGVTLYFKAYSQDVHKLQSGTVHAMFTDEELPEELMDELLFRLEAVDGHFHQVFTATKGQEFWYRAIERVGKKDEVFKDAFKLQVSMYDCLEYEDGDKNTPWTREKIAKAKAMCKDEATVQKRVYGRFAVDEGRKYAAFSRQRNVREAFKIPSDWLIYSGVDIGSGGTGGHPAAFAFVAVKPDFTYGAVFKGWRGNKTEVTTSNDILHKYRAARGKMKPIAQYYDHAAVDFKTYAARLNESFTKAEKGQELGVELLNTLFKMRMLDIFDIDELEGAANEFSSLLSSTPKNKAKDDFIDAIRYAITLIPWDFAAAAELYKDDVKEIEEEPKVLDGHQFTDWEREKSRTKMLAHKEVEDYMEQEIAEFNDLMEDY